jgi:aspartyl protease
MASIALTMARELRAAVTVKGGQRMAKSVRIPITNVFMNGDYTGRIHVGSHNRAVNVILDTGSSAFALDGHKYHPDTAAGDKTTTFAQTDRYGDNSGWTGAVLKTRVALGDGAAQVTIPDANVAVAYEQTSNMFRSADGILGLAYAPLDDAYRMPQDTWAHKYTGIEVSHGVRGDIQPLLTQLAGENVVSDIVSFYTKRSFIHSGGGDPANDPLNQGWMIVGGGEEATDLYTGAFQTAKVLADAWYNTNLTAVIVGNASPIAVPAHGPQGMPSNSIVDSGTNSLNLGSHLLKAIIAKFTPGQQALLDASVFGQSYVSASQLDLGAWPDITFVLQGDAGDVRLRVAASDYWQVNAGKVGAAAAALTPGQAGLAILGLPLMNGYFTIFDGEADGGRGVIRFATIKR